MNNSTYVCVPCRFVGRHHPICPRCGEDTVAKVRWSAPKKNNDRAWKRIEKGEWNWDRRKVRRRPPNPVYNKDSWERYGKYGSLRRYIGVDRKKDTQPIEVDFGG